MSCNLPRDQRRDSRQPRRKFTERQAGAALTEFVWSTIQVRKNSNRPGGLWLRVIINKRLTSVMLRQILLERLSLLRNEWSSASGVIFVNAKNNDAVRTTTFGVASVEGSSPVAVAVAGRLEVAAGLPGEAVVGLPADHPLLEEARVVAVAEAAQGLDAPAGDPKLLDRVKLLPKESDSLAFQKIC